MLQLKNIKKTYRTKAGEVNALNDISLIFPAKGLVFITGKSGCGKTTLLNVIGGLDGIDEGEITVQDKTFSSFSDREYDSYRNTFIGFIFQEYNLLPEYTVENNIKIAMELQGRSADAEAFSKLLKDVGIDDLKDRKPSELSGGQRQRVAIARALVKQPRIIMADEPTGALDSNTGVQVLETLKKLSKDKLVIVVSHDKEFAEKYADRIIRLVDGKVAEDVTFTEREMRSNVSEQGKTLVVRAGTDLTEEEKNALAKAVKDRKNIELTEKLCFRDKRATGTVEKTVAEPIAFNKSKMKLRSTFFLGVKALVVKPFRLIVTIIISALAFAVFGLFDTIADFNTQNVLENHLRTMPSSTMTACADYVLDNGAGDKYALKVSEEEINALEQETDGTVKGIFDLRDNISGGISHTYLIAELRKSSSLYGRKYYSNAVNGFIEFDGEKELNADGSFKDFDYTLVGGRYPKLVYNSGKATDESMEEVAISTYLADSIIYYLNGEPLDQRVVSTREELLEKYITVGDESYKIVGLIDCGDIPEKYDVLKETTVSNTKTNALGNDYTAYINAGAQKCLFVGNGFLEAKNKEYNSAKVFYAGNADWTVLSKGALKNQACDYVYASRYYDENNILLFAGDYPDNGKVTLANDEILIHHYNIETLFNTEIKALGTDERNRVRGLIQAMKTGTKEENRAYLAEIFTLLDKGLSERNTMTVTVTKKSGETGETITKELKIVGVYFGIELDRTVSTTWYQLMMNDGLMNEFGIYTRQGDYNKVLFSSSSIRSGAATIVEYLTGECGFRLNWYNNSALSVINDNEDMIKQIADLFLYVAIALAAFSVFMLYNYISTSIANKKQSVGVLRGLGAGGKDIFLAFLSESLIIAVINGVLANVLSAFGCTIVNAYIINTMNVSIHFALFGIRQILIIAGIGILTAIISSALPIIKISKKKPVELIKRS